MVGNKKPVNLSGLGGSVEAQLHAEVCTKPLDSAELLHAVCSVSSVNREV